MIPLRIAVAAVSGAVMVGVGVGLWARERVHKNHKIVNAEHGHFPRCLPDPYDGRPHFIPTR
jgi:hypothetical protein